MVLHFPKRRAFLPRAYDAETFPRLALLVHYTAHYAQLAIKSLCPWCIYSWHTHPLLFLSGALVLTRVLGCHIRRLVLASEIPCLEVISFFTYQEQDPDRSTTLLKTRKRKDLVCWDAGKGMSPFTH